MLFNTFLIVLFGILTLLKGHPATKSYGRHGVIGLEFVKFPLSKIIELVMPLVIVLNMSQLLIKSYPRQKVLRTLQ